MKLFLWKYLDLVTDYFHSGGGLIVFADDINMARDLFFEKAKNDFKRNRDKKIDAMTVEPDLVIDVGSYVPDDRIIVFSDAGCC